MRAPSVCARDQRRPHVGRGAARGDADHHVVGADPPARPSSPMPAFTSSSAPSTDRTSAGSPPAMMPTTISGGVPKVGGHSAASSTPSRPLVPAPT